MTIQSLGYKNGDRVSISINGKEHSPNKPGINVVVMDFMTFQVTEAVSFDTAHDKDASEQLMECIDMIPVGTLVLIAVRGEANYYMTGEFCSLTTLIWGFIYMNHRKTYPPYENGLQRSPKFSNAYNSW